MIEFQVQYSSINPFTSFHVPPQMSLVSISSPYLLYRKHYFSPILSPCPLRHCGLLWVLARFHACQSSSFQHLFLVQSEMQKIFRQVFVGSLLKKKLAGGDKGEKGMLIHCWLECHLPTLMENNNNIEILQKTET